MNEIKEWKPLVKITLISGREIFTAVDISLLNKSLENSKFVKLNWMLINSWSISTVEPYNGNDVDQYIVSITDSVIRERLREIQKERKAKNFSINWVKHLIQIYTDRFWEISNGK
jgi:hypothetical protein